MKKPLVSYESSGLGFIQLFAMIQLRLWLGDGVILRGYLYPDHRANNLDKTQGLRTQTRS